jgi:hypothetical protein
MKAESVELFRNLSDWDIDPPEYWDLHNEFGCTDMEYGANVLKLKFASISDSFRQLTLMFDAASIENIKLPLDTPLNMLTLELLYRGRNEVNNQLLEFDEMGRSYFYLEFCEGPKLGFWTKELSLAVVS